MAKPQGDLKTDLLKFLESESRKVVGTDIMKFHKWIALVRGEKETKAKEVRPPAAEK